MGFGNWIEERQFEFPADTVYETLLGVLAHFGMKIEKWDATQRGVTAYAHPSWSQLSSWRQLFFGPSIGGRIAASVQPSGDLASVVTIESGPAYEPWMFGEPWHRNQVERILTALSQALGEPRK